MGIKAGIPTEADASAAARRIISAYAGTIPESEYSTWLYAYDVLTAEELISIKNNIIQTTKSFNSSYGLSPSLFGLIIELAQAGVLFKPAPIDDTDEGHTANLCLWEHMGLLRIQLDVIKRVQPAAYALLLKQRETVEAWNKTIQVTKLISLASPIHMRDRITEKVDEYVKERNDLAQALNTAKNQVSNEFWTKELLPIQQEMLECDRKIQSKVGLIGISTGLGGITVVTGIAFGAILIAIGIILAYILELRQAAYLKALEGAEALKRARKEQAEKDREIAKFQLDAKYNAGIIDINTYKIELAKIDKAYYERTEQIELQAKEDRKKAEELRPKGIMETLTFLAGVGLVTAGIIIVGTYLFKE